MGGRKIKAHRHAKNSLNMNDEELLFALETLAKTIDVQVRYEKGDFTGGLYRLGDFATILLQKGDPVYKKIQILARELGAFELDQIYVLPALRELITEEMQSGQNETQTALPISTV